MLLQLKLATKGFVSQYDEEEIDFLKSPDLDELDNEDDIEEEEEFDEKESSQAESHEEPDEDMNDDAEIFNEKDEINDSFDFFC